MFSWKIGSVRQMPGTPLCLCDCVQEKERTGEWRNGNRERNQERVRWTGHAPCVSLCKEHGCLYSGFIYVMPCDSIVRSRSTELVSPPSHQPPSLDKAIWICSAPSSNAWEQLYYCGGSLNVPGGF